MARGRPPKQKPKPAIVHEEASQTAPEEDLAEWVTEVASKGTLKGSTTTTVLAKRKREVSAEEVAEESLPNKRVAGRKSAAPTEAGITNPRGHEKAKLGKLPRPTETRHIVRTYPVSNKKNEDIFEVPTDSEKPPKHSPNAQTSREASVKKVSRHPTKAAKNLRASAEAAVPAEGHSSAIFNGRANGSDKRAHRKSKTTERATSSVEETPSSPAESAAHAEAFEGEYEPMSDKPEPRDRAEVDESSYHHADNDDETGLRGINLFGYEPEWKEILRAAHSVGGSRSVEDRIPKLRLQTKTIKALICDIKEARSLYQDCSHDQPANHLYNLLDAIEEQIKHDDISEAKAYNMKAEMIRDIYARAIPALVFLLESSVSFHTLHPKGLHRYQALQEIVRLQNMIVSLCMKAKIWKARPNTNYPIKKPTMLKILPYTRGMKKFFDKELQEQRWKWKTVENARKTAISQEEPIRQSQRQREESIAETHNCSDLLQHIQREREIFWSSRRPKGIAGFYPSQDIGFSRQSAKWTQEEEKALMVQLQNKYTKDQSGIFSW